MATLAPTSRLRGRTVELRTLVDALGRAAGGRPAIVVVEGEAGIGKSRLLAEALEAARSRGLQVVAGRGQDLERNRPFGLQADGFGCSRSSPDPRRAAIAALLATHGGDRGATTVSSDPALQFQAVDAFLDLVEALAPRGPLVLGLDDLQWADPSSLLTLGALARRVTDNPVALLASLRPLPRSAELERTLEALDAAGAPRLVLGQLDREAVTELVAEVVAAKPGPRLMAAVAAAGGNPLFVTELVAALLSEGAIRTVDGRAEVAEMTLPPNLRLTILRRLSFLPDDTLEALRAASILGSGFSPTELSATTDRSVLELSSVLGQALRARVLEDDGDRLRFRHDLIHEAIAWLTRAAGRGRGGVPLPAGPRARPVGAGAGPHPAVAHPGHPGTGPRGAPGAGVRAAVPRARRPAARRRLGGRVHGPPGAGRPRGRGRRGRAGPDRGRPAGRPPGHRPGHGLAGHRRGAAGEPGPRARAHRRGGAAGRPQPPAVGAPQPAPPGPGQHPHGPGPAPGRPGHAPDRPADQRGARRPLAAPLLPGRPGHGALPGRRVGRRPGRARGGPRADQGDRRALQPGAQPHRREPDRPAAPGRPAAGRGGGGRGRRGPRQRPRLGWESLTRTERQVVDLVVEGLSNPQIGDRLFVSPRTVQTHVAHVFTKLEVSSRAQLAAEAARRREAAG